ncbi:MAG: HlyC/CorC family transporter [Gammaproteobacteria bacterium]
MSEIPSNGASLESLLALLIVLLLVSAFFSGSETALMSINRYRLRHSAREGHRAARIVEKLLARPDRLIGLILLGNNLANIAASALVTVIAIRLGGQGAIVIGAGLLTLVVLIFAEVAPKTIAALHPERLAYPAAIIYYPLLKIAYPVVWLINFLANGVLRMLGLYPRGGKGDSLSKEELRSVVAESGILLPRRHKEMLVGVLDLEKVTVDDIMIPRNEINGIDLEDDWDHVEEQLEDSQHTRLVVFRGDLDDTVGILHLRSVLKDLTTGDLDHETLEERTGEAYYVPEGTPLSQQMLHFQKVRRRVALVVDEYGDIQGLVTLDDILEEIVGEFTTDTSDFYHDVHKAADGSYIVQGSANVRELNRTMNWHLPTAGPKTMNGLVLEELGTIPDAGVSLMIAGYPMEILQASGNAIRSIRMGPKEPPSVKESD